MKAGIIFFTLFAIYVSFGVFISNVNLQNLTFDSESEFYDYSGVINVHSNKSSGSGSVQEIISAANNADLDFISFNNENPINQKQPTPITFGDLNVFYGLELNHKNSRFLTISSEEAKVFESHSSIEIHMSNILDFESDDLIILAHPNKEDYKWEYPIPPALTGIEVINLREVWNLAWKDSKLIFLSSLLFYPFNPELFFIKIFSQDSTSEKLYDRISAERDTIAFLGTDATSKLKVFSKSYIRFPDYETLFLLAKNHILLEEELTRTKKHAKIIQAFKKGHSYFSLDVLGNPKGFSVYHKKNGIKKLLPKTFNNPEEIFINVPEHKYKYRVVVLKNGKKYRKFSNSSSFKLQEDGIYRVRVDIKPRFPFIRRTNWIPWIYSNSFRYATESTKQ